MGLEPKTFESAALHASHSTTEAIKTYVYTRIRNSEYI